MGDNPGRGEKEREREGREWGAESMPSIKQEGLCSLKLVRAEPRGVYRKSVLSGCWGEFQYPAISFRLNVGGRGIYLGDKRQNKSFVSPGWCQPEPPIPA